jgi:hypothetical protein
MGRSFLARGRTVLTYLYPDGIIPMCNRVKSFILDVNLWFMPRLIL